MRVTIKDGALRFEVRAKPRAKKSAVIGEIGEALDVALAAPPIDGAANAELVAFLSERLDVAKSNVTIVRGMSSRTKLVDVRGLTEAELRARLGAS